jgi:hypothetical protein
VAIGKQLLKAIPVVVAGVGVRVLIFAMSVPPDQAGTNLGKWLEKIGVSHIPNWIANPPPVHLIIEYSLAFVLVYSIGVWLIPLIIERRRKPFEIIYDQKNVGRQFRELRTVGIPSRPIHGVEYRIKIRNKTAKTVEEVKITSEVLGLLGKLPVRLIFDENQQKTYTLDPNASAFVSWFFVPLPLAQPGTLMRETASAAYGPIRVTVSAKDTKAVERLFRFAPITLTFDPYKESLVS